MGGINPVGRKGYDNWNLERVEDLPSIKRGAGGLSHRQEIVEMLQSEAPRHPGRWYKVFEHPDMNHRATSTSASKLGTDLGPQFECASREAAIYVRYVGRRRKRKAA